MSTRENIRLIARCSLQHTGKPYLRRYQLAQARISLYNFSPPEFRKSHILNRTINKLYIITVLPAKSDSDVMFCLQNYQHITCILLEPLAQIKKILRV